MEKDAKGYKFLKILPVFLIVIVLIVAIIFFSYKTQIQTSTSSIPQTTIITTTITTITTTIKPHPIYNYTFSPSQIFKLLGSYPIPGLVFSGNNNGTFPMCFVNYSSAVYLNPEMGGNISTPITPLFNKTEPFAAFTQIQEINPLDISKALNILSAYDGYCSSIEPLLKGNSTFSSTQIKIAGYNGYLVKFDYLNQNALNLTSTPYKGPMPNVSYYIVAVPYKNVIVRVVYWGFTGYMNVSQMEDIGSEIIKALSSINSTS